MRRIAIAALSICAALLPLSAAAEDVAAYRVGADLYQTGPRVTVAEDGLQDVFAAAETVRLAAPITGSAHLAGRRVEVDTPVTHSLYAAAYSIALDGAVGGAASLMAHDVHVSAPVERSLRAAARQITVAAPVGGDVLLRAARVHLDAAIAGDASIAAERLTFGPAARIDGSLRLYTDARDDIDVPESVIAPARIEHHPRPDWAGERVQMPQPDWPALALRYIGWIIVVALIASLAAAVAPQGLASARRCVLQRPFASLGYGFLTLSALIGSALVFALTLIGILISPAMLALTVLTGFAGYVVGSYSFGAGVLIAIGRGEPGSIGQRIAAAFIGAAGAGLLALIPVLGWLFVLALVLAGTGALTLRLLRPAFLTD